MHRDQTLKLCRSSLGFLLLSLVGCSADVGVQAEEESASSVTQAATTQAAGYVLIEGTAGSFSALSAFSMNSSGVRTR